MKYIYRFADHLISVDSVHDEVHKLCSLYRVDVPTDTVQTGEIPLDSDNAFLQDFDAPVDFAVRTTQTDIDFERARSEQSRENPGFIPTDAYLETLAVYRKIAEKMPDYGTVLFHGSAIAVDGEAYIFTAKSGTGKSTHVRLWREMLGDRAVMVNDDKPLIRIAPKCPARVTEVEIPSDTAGDLNQRKETGNDVEKSPGIQLADCTKERIMVYGTPWDGKHRLSTNIAVPVKAICILERGETNRIEPIDVRQAMPMLLQQTYRPIDPLQMTKTLPLVDRLAAGTPLYRLHCNMDPDAARVAYEGMRKPG